MSNWTQNFCQNLRHLRQVHTMTQKEMARILGVSVTTYGKIERGDPHIRIHCAMLSRVCIHFQISADDILLQNWPQMMKEKPPAFPK